MGQSTNSRVEKYHHWQNCTEISIIVFSKIITSESILYVVFKAYSHLFLIFLINFTDRRNEKQKFEVTNPSLQNHYVKNNILQKVVVVRQFSSLDFLFPCLCPHKMISHRTI